MGMPPDLTIRMSPHHRSPLEGVRLVGESASDITA